MTTIQHKGQVDEIYGRDVETLIAYLEPSFYSYSSSLPTSPTSGSNNTTSATTRTPPPVIQPLLFHRDLGAMDYEGDNLDQMTQDGHRLYCPPSIHYWTQQRLSLRCTKSDSKMTKYVTNKVSLWTQSYTSIVRNVIKWNN